MITIPIKLCIADLNTVVIVSVSIGIGIIIALVVAGYFWKRRHTR